MSAKHLWTMLDMIPMHVSSALFMVCCRSVKAITRRPAGHVWQKSKMSCQDDQLARHLCPAIKENWNVKKVPSVWSIKDICILSVYILYVKNNTKTHRMPRKHFFFQNGKAAPSFSHTPVCPTYAKNVPPKLFSGRTLVWPWWKSFGLHCRW